MKQLVLIIAIMATCSCRKIDDEPKIICQGLSIVEGQNQVLTPGQTLPLPLTVLVTDESGMPISGARLEWVANGGGYLDKTETITDPHGTAQVTWTPGFGTNQSVVVNVINDNSNTHNNCGWDMEFVSE